MDAEMKPEEYVKRGLEAAAKACEKQSREYRAMRNGFIHDPSYARACELLLAKAIACEDLTDQLRDIDPAAILGAVGDEPTTFDAWWTKQSEHGWVTDDYRNIARQAWQAAQADKP
jgi:hypothetical protein